MAELLSWFDPDGTEWKFDDSAGYLGVIGRTGFFGPTTTLQKEDIPQRPGARAKFVKTEVTQLFLPVYIHAATESAFATKRRALIDALLPMRGPGKLRATAHDGMVREATCYCVDGLQGNEAAEARGMSNCDLGLVFEAVDPYWYDVTATTQSFVVDPLDTVPTPFFPILPIVLNPMRHIDQTVTVSNSGNVETWPVWTLTGPARYIGLTNNTTNDVYSLDITLPSTSSTLIIDFTQKTATLDGDNVSYAMVFDSLMWPLVRGANSITVYIGDVDDDTELTLSYKQRYVSM